MKNERNNRTAPGEVLCAPEIIVGERLFTCPLQRMEVAQLLALTALPEDPSMGVSTQISSFRDMV